MKKQLIKLTEEYAQIEKIGAFRFRLKQALRRCQKEVINMVE